MNAQEKAQNKQGHAKYFFVFQNTMAVCITAKKDKYVLDQLRHMPMMISSIFRLY
jgi:hypothetical protein